MKALRYNNVFSIVLSVVVPIATGIGIFFICIAWLMFPAYFYFGIIWNWFLANINELSAENYPCPKQETIFTTKVTSNVFALNWMLQKWKT